MGNDISRLDSDSNSEWPEPPHSQSQRHRRRRNRSPPAQPPRPNLHRDTPPPRPRPEAPCEAKKPDPSPSMALKELGNEHFKAGRYAEAEVLYSQAITQNSTRPQLFSNRALTRLRLSNNLGAEDDAQKAIDLYGPKNPSAMKSYYFLAQAQLAVNHPMDALNNAKIAYGMCIEQKGKDVEAMSQFILRTKQEVWRRAETIRLRGADDTLKEIEELLEDRCGQELQAVQQRFENEEIGETGRDEEQEVIKKEAQERLNTVRQAFAQGKEILQERVIPDYLIDGITFEIMHDPVVTPSGVSYDRASILKHLRSNPFDPITRAPLTENQLRPNLALKEKMPSTQFDAAVKASKQLKAKPSNDELLELGRRILYALYKQTLQDPSFDKATAPGMFDLKGKAKYNAWQKVVNDGVTPQQAETKYVQLVNSLKTKYGFDPNKVPEEVGSK
ncbi:MAG: hypothetical protein Q9227_002870 [Pyrenula ochraceoflavens]